MLCTAIMLANTFNAASRDNVDKACLHSDFFRSRRTCKGDPQPMNSATRHSIAPAAVDFSQRAGVSYSRSSTHINHPAGGSLFPKNATLSGQFDTFLKKIEKKPYFVVYFARFHMQVLHELYTYLTKIFATMNLSHISEIESYLANEQTQALNKKTLIINHLVNIIEEQSNQAILARFPLLPQQIATYAGTILMKHDYGSDLNLMLDKSEETLFTDTTSKKMILDMRTDYMDLFGKYLAFFNQYTADIDKENKKNGYVGISDFAQNAATIQKRIANATTKIDSKLDSKAKLTALQNITTINPPMFFYDAETLRGLKVIPQLAKSLPKNAQSIGWPEEQVKNANSGKTMKSAFSTSGKSYPLAFYNSDRTRLFVNLPVASDVGVYTQELLKQPAWLNSKDGIIKMLRICLGDFYTVLDPVFDGESILDPCLICIIKNAAKNAGLSVASGTECSDCTSFISQLEQEIKKHEESSTSEPPPVIDGGTLPTDSGTTEGGDEFGDIDNIL